MRAFLAAGLAVLGSTSGVLIRFADPRIDEASGLALGVRSPGIAWVQNDSGDSNRVFAVDLRSGRTAAVVDVRGATNVDWEDLAIAPDPAGRSSIWIADTGDNDARRPEVRLYRIAEPRVPAGAGDRTLRSAAAAVWRLRYPAGSVDTEALAVTPAGVAYLITKSVLGQSAVYRVPAGPDPAHVRLLQRVGSISLAPHGVPNPFGLPGELAVTGATVSPDGTVLAVRTYAEAYFWRLTGGDVAAALRRPPVRVALPRQPQGEGIALRTDREALLDSEGVHASVLAVPVPRLASPSASAPRSSPTARASAGSPATPATPAAPTHPPTRRWPVGLGIAAAVLLAGLLGKLLRGGRIGAWRSRRTTTPSR